VFVSAYYLYREVERDGGREESVFDVLDLMTDNTLWMCQALKKSS
jgi:hypothetical protein